MDGYEAVATGAREERAGEVIGIAARTLGRWRLQGIGDDRRAGPSSPPPHRLSDEERQAILDVANLSEYRNLSPRQIVPLLADGDKYVASESRFYRVLREAAWLKRERQRSFRKARA